MAAPLAIPLIAAVAPEATAAALSYLGLGATAVGAGVLGGSLINKFLTPKSKSTEFSTATAEFLKAEQDREASKAKGLGGLAQAEANKEIAANYDYLNVDPGTGQIAINSDKALAEGGSLQLTEANGKVTLRNDMVNVEIPYTNYGSNDVPSAVPVGVPINMATSDDGLFPIVKDSGVALGDPQLVAATAIENSKREIQNYADYVAGELPPAQSQDLVDIQSVPAAQPVTQSQDYLGTVPTAQDLRDPALDAELAREAARGTQRGYLEDAGRSSDSGAIANAESLEQARAAERADAATAPTNTNPVTSGISDESNKSTVLRTEDPNYNKNTATKKINTSGVVNRNFEAPKEKSNPLHDWVNYTYNISWYMVPREVMNQITNGKISPGGEDAIIAQSELILKSGGSKSENKGKYFGVDFFIDNLVLKSIVGTSARNRSTDVVEINFDVVEPYNVTLLPRLIASAYAQTGKADWSACFYLLKIEFKGYDEEGIPQTIPKTTKYVPISLVSMDFDVTHKGAQYRFKAIPCHHFAQTLLDNQIPFHMEINGGTLEELFNGAATTVASQAPVSNGSTASARQQEIANTNNGGTPVGSNTFTKGVAEALNDNEKYIKSKKAIKFPTVYKFRFQDGIGSKSVVDPKNWTANGFRMADPKNPNEQVGKSIKLDTQKNVFRVQAGTRITDLISSIMQVSDYMAEQYSPSGNEDKPLYSFKIVPEVKFGEYDTLTNTWQREVTFVIVPYTIFGYDHPGFGQKAPPGATKRYRWIFTGQNKDIIDVRIKYEAAFFTVKNAGIEALMEADGNADNSSPATSSDSNSTMSGVFPRRVKAVNDIADQNNTGPKTEDRKTLAVAELFKRQFDSQPDNFNLNLVIVGDPDLIQQDNIMYGVNTDKNKLIYDFGSLNYLHYEAYFMFQFAIPRKDYDDETGLFDISSGNTNYFDGFYKIVSVTSEFRGGKFTQKLDNFKVSKQSNVKTDQSPVKAYSPKSTVKTEDPTGTLPIPSGTNVARGVEEAVTRAVQPITNAVRPAVEAVTNTVRDLI